jgi:hypothetical protein
MFQKKILLAAVLAAALGSALPAGQASAATATGQTKFTVALQPVLILDYYQQIDLTVDAASLSTLVGTSANLSASKGITASASGTALTGDAALSTSTSGLSNISLTLDKVWSVRSILGKTSTTSVTIGLGATSSGTAATLTAGTDTGSTIGRSNPGTTSTVPNGPEQREDGRHLLRRQHLHHRHLHLIAPAARRS